MVAGRLRRSAARFLRRRDRQASSTLRSATPSPSMCSAGEVTAKVASLRTINWQSLSMNSVMVFSPNTFRGAPFTSLATLSYPDGGTTEKELAFLKAVVGGVPGDHRHPGQGGDRDRQRHRRPDRLGGTRGLRDHACSPRCWFSAGPSPPAAAGGSTMPWSSRRSGATRGKLIGAYALEFLLLGAATAVFGLVAGSIAAWFVLANDHGYAVRLPARPGAWRGRAGAGADAGLRTGRHMAGSRTESRADLAKSVRNTVYRACRCRP